MTNPGDEAPAGADYIVRRLDDLQKQITQLGPSVVRSFNTTVNHLNSLQTSSSVAPDLNAGTIAGDGVIHWFDTSPVLTLTVPVVTGSLLITVGAGYAWTNTGNSTVWQYASFQASAPSGWSYALMTVYSARQATNIAGGEALTVSAPIPVPATELITITAKFGVKSLSTTPLATAQFFQPYLITQVIN